MTVRKYRYISFTFSIQENRKLDLEDCIITIIKDKVNKIYGDKLLYRLHNILLLEYLLDNNIFIIRVDRDISKFVIFSLLSCGQINQIKCNFKLLFISGIYKKLLKRTLKSLL